MSRIAKSPITIPAGCEIKQDGQTVSVKGPKGELNTEINALVQVAINDGVLTVSPAEEEQQAWAQAGTARSIINNMVTGVTNGFERRLVLNGVGYRAQAKGQSVNLTLGFSHPIDYELPEGIKAETPSQTEIVLTGIDKQLLGQVAANIRSFRPPEPYKGKGVRYADEYVRRKEAKKK
jgi:large subunit ribosomal protein L6